MSIGMLKINAYPPTSSDAPMYLYNTSRASTPADSPARAVTVSQLHPCCMNYPFCMAESHVSILFGSNNILLAIPFRFSSHDPVTCCQGSVGEAEGQEGASSCRET